MSDIGLLPKVGRYEFTAEPFHCDFSDHLFFGHLGNALLNAADFHSNDRNYGMHYLNTIHRTWVLSRLVMEMEQMPVAYEKFAIETWVEGAMRYFTSRNFAVKSLDGDKVYGYGRSVWAMIDTDTRQPADILDVQGGLLNKYVETDKPCPIDKPGRVRMGHGATLVRTIETYYNDVDVNGHINSVKYIEHILDLFDIAWYRQYRLQRMEVAYVAEAHQGDRLSLWLEKESEGAYFVRITRDDEKKQEIVRSLLKFVKD